MNKKLFILKSILTITLCFSVLSISNAQEVKFGIKGGFNASSISAMGGLAKLNNTSNVIDISTTYKSGLHVGVISQIDFSSKFFLQPELLFSMQGVSAEFIYAGTGSDSEKLTLNYLQLPIYAGYKIHAGQGLDVILGAGPYMGYGIGGTEDVFSDTGFKRFDWGLSAMGGVQFEKFQITIGYDLGLNDLVDFPGWKTVKDFAGLSSLSNRNFKASIAYLF